MGSSNKRIPRYVSPLLPFSKTGLRSARARKRTWKVELRRVAIVDGLCPMQFGPPSLSLFEGSLLALAVHSMPRQRLIPFGFTLIGERFYPDSAPHPGLSRACLHFSWPSSVLFFFLSLIDFNIRFPPSDYPFDGIGCFTPPSLLPSPPQSCVANWGHSVWATRVPIRLANTAPGLGPSEGPFRKPRPMFRKGNPLE